MEQRLSDDRKTKALANALSTLKIGITFYFKYKMEKRTLELSGRLHFLPLCSTQFIKTLAGNRLRFVFDFTGRKGINCIVLIK